MRNIDLARKYEDYIISLRRHFHEHPELSGEEYQTMERIEAELQAMGIPYIEIPNGGILGKIQGAKDGGRAVLLRADIDALLMQESEENLAGKRSYMSHTEGVAHTCGHDGHTAMLLGAARILMDQIEELEGTVYLCFERGEEKTGNVRYILHYLDTHDIHIDSSFGIHLYALLDSGKFGILDGAMMASTMGFNITIEGNGGHGSRPDQAVNPIDAFAAIYSGMQGLRLRCVDPFKALTYSIGMVHAGTAHNIIPERLSFAGSMRTFDREGVGMTFYHEFRGLVDNTCAAYNCRAVYDNYTVPGPMVVNDPECAQLARNVIAQELGSESIVAPEPWMATDPMGMYLYLWPGVYAFLGIRNPEKGTGAAHHHPKFDLDESVLAQGAAGAAAYAMEFLKSDIDTSSRKIEGGFRALLRKTGKRKNLEELYHETFAADQF